MKSESKIVLIDVEYCFKESEIFNSMGIKHFEDWSCLCQVQSKLNTSFVTKSKDVDWNNSNKFMPDIVIHKNDIFDARNFYYKTFKEAGENVCKHQLRLYWNDLRKWLKNNPDFQIHTIIGTKEK